jgi:hypothetical protein
MTRTLIKLLLDEHIWTGLTEALKKQGYDALHIRDTDQGGLDDESRFWRLLLLKGVPC